MADLIHREDAIRKLVMYGTREFPDPEILAHAIHEVQTVPAVDAVEVKHGRWVKEQVNPAAIRYRCSECGEVSVIGIENYCWNCGAKMDGEEEHNATELRTRFIRLTARTAGQESLSPTVSDSANTAGQCSEKFR